MSDCLFFPHAPATHTPRSDHTTAGRAIFQIMTGEKLAPDVIVMKSCGNKMCVLSKHLVAVPKSEAPMMVPTSAAGINARKTHCNAGHAFDAANTRICWRNGRSYRKCLACASERNREYRARNK